MLLALAAHAQSPLPVAASAPARSLTEQPVLALLSSEPIPPPSLEEQLASNRLTLAQIEDLATATHPALRAADARVRAARGNWLQVGLKPNPVIGYQGSEIGDEGRAGQQGGFISQEFVTAHKLGLNRAVAMREIASAEQEYQRTRLQVLTTARQRYFEALAAERAVALARQLTAMARQAVEVSDLRLKALEGTRSALLQSQIELDSITLLEQQAANRHEAAWRALTAVIGDPQTVPRLLDSGFDRPLPGFDWGPLLDQVLRENPQLVQLQIDVERARWSVARAVAGRVPNVEVQASAQFDYATEDPIAGLQISMPLPIYDRNQGAIAQANAELAAAQAALEENRLAVQQRLAAVLRDYDTARQRVSKYSESILPAARETLAMMVEGYEQGELEYLQVLTMQQTFAQKNIAYLADLESAWKNWAEIEGLLSGPLQETSN